MLALQGISKNFGDQIALRNVDLTIKRGEIVGLVGPNGSGKTTLMKIVNGLIVNYDGNLVRDEAVGALIESPKYFEAKSGRYNLKYFNELFGSHENIEKLLKQLNMESYQKKKVKEYSMGMKQRLGIALALTGEPAYLILDEPTNGMDPSGVYEVLKYLKALAVENNIGILISSHILTDVETLCDRVYLIKSGEIQKEYQPLAKWSLQTGDVEKVRALLEHVPSAALEGNLLTVHKGESKRLHQLLKEYGISASQVVSEETDLEDIYFNMMGEVRT
ncbi:ABC transporter ATP-binding protein [Planococcus maitriensis]|nr:ABC transporter ATP-binding protein [Planococcus maitriensis]